MTQQANSWAAMGLRGAIRAAIDAEMAEAARRATGCTCTSCTSSHTHFGRVKPYRCPDCQACQDVTPGLLDRP